MIIVVKNVEQSCSTMKQHFLLDKFFFSILKDQDNDAKLSSVISDGRTKNQNENRNLKEDLETNWEREVFAYWVLLFLVECCLLLALLKNVYPTISWYYFPAKPTTPTAKNAPTIFQLLSWSRVNLTLTLLQCYNTTSIIYLSPLSWWSPFYIYIYVYT